MSRWLPYPVYWVLLVALWLLLNQTLAPGHVLLGALLAWGAVRSYAGLEPPRGRAHRRLRAAVALTWLVLVDMVRSNIAVARIVLFSGTRRRTSAFVTLTLRVRHPGALAVLAIIITATPGTAWARYERESNRLTIHILDLVDEAGWVRMVRERYERRLEEIFE